MLLASIGDAMAQQADQLRSALRPRPDHAASNRTPTNRTPTNLGGAARAAAQSQADFARQVGRGEAVGRGNGFGRGNDLGRGGGFGQSNQFGRGGYQPRYPDFYPSFYYGYTLGNPGFNVPGYVGGGVYPLPIYGGHGYGGYGYGYGYGYGPGFPLRGGSVTRGLPGTPTPGSHYFGNPHASQYIPQY